MANSLRYMRGRRGYKGLLRGNATMLGRIQIRRLRLATLLHAIQSRWFSFIIWSAAILTIADCLIRSEFGNIDFDNYGLEWLIVSAIVILAIFITATIVYRCILKSDPYVAARDDVERILIEVRDSRGHRATVDRIAGANEAEFLCDFYEVKPLTWLGILSLIVMFGLLVAGGINHVLHYKATFDKITSNYYSVEMEISDAFQKTGLCNEIYTSDSSAVLYGSHYTKCIIGLEDERELYARVDLNEEFLIESLSYNYTINQDITQIPQLDLVNDDIIILQTSLESVSHLLKDENLLTYNYQIDNEFVESLAEKEYRSSHYVFRDATPENASCHTYLTYSYLDGYDSPMNYIYITSN